MSTLTLRRKLGVTSIRFKLITSILEETSELKEKVRKYLEVEKPQMKTLRKDCFGHYRYPNECMRPKECPMRIECLEKEIEQIRKSICGYNF